MHVGSLAQSWLAPRLHVVTLAVMSLVMNPAAHLGGRPQWPFEGSYLVDPASSHMLVSKIKPCMSKYKQLYGETANGSLNQL